MRKILFLDIDGVLNNADFFDRQVLSDGQHLVNVTGGHDMIDPENVAFLNQFLEESDAFVVISSTWRRHFKRVEILDALTKGGFKHPKRVIGMTPVKFSHMERAGEIALWLDENGDDVDGFAVVDDNPLDFHESFVTHRLVLTEFVRGMREEHVGLLYEKLTLPYKKKETE